MQCLPRSELVWLRKERGLKKLKTKLMLSKRPSKKKWTLSRVWKPRSMTQIRNLKGLARLSKVALVRKSVGRKMSADLRKNMIS